MNKDYCGNWINIISINRKKKREIWNFSVRDGRREGRKKKKKRKEGKKRELEKIYLKVRFRFLNVLMCVLWALNFCFDEC